MHLINFVTDPPISVNALSDKYSIYVNNTKLKGAFEALGAFVFYYSPKEGPSRTLRGTYDYPEWNTQLVMTEDSPVESLQLSPNGVAQLDLPDPFPCTGMMTADMEGFIVAPTIRLEMSDGRDLAIMLLSPRREPAKIDIQKTTLSISSDKLDATIFITGNDLLGCTGTLSGQGFKTAKLLLTRKPDTSSIQRGFIEKIAEAKGAGQMSVTWKPVSRIFEDTLVIFRPDSIKDYDVRRVADLIGADDDTFLGEDRPPFIIGDGKGTSYKLTLVLDRLLRKELSDETSITLN